MLRASLALLFACTLTAGAAQAAKAPVQTKPEGVKHEWNARDDGTPRSYQVGTTTFRFSTKPGDDMVRTVATITAPGVAPRTFVFETTWGAAGFGAGKLDASVAGPQLLLTSYSGGAHCCTEIWAVYPEAGKWKAVSLGGWDGEGLGPWPKDLNGDGVADFVFPDNRFLYTFAPYAGSVAPVVVRNLRGGVVTDVSKDPAYKALFQADLKDSQEGCLKHSNAACAAFVANAARLGRKDWAWSLMLANYDKADDWTLPSGCKVAVKDAACPTGQEIVFKTYPEALDWFLRDTGYY